MFNKAFIIVLTAGAIMAWFANPVSGQIVRDGLISYWTFDEADIKGGKVKDVIGGQDAAIIGTPKQVEGKIKGALQFNGTTDYLEVTEDINASKIPAKEITLEAWVFPENFIEWGGYLSCFQDNGGFEKGWTLGCNWQLSFALSTKGADDGDGILTYLKANPVDPSQWYHIAGTYDGKTMNIYINGDLENTSQVQSGDINYPDHAFFTLAIYKDDNEHFPFKGKLDEVRLYKKALSEKEVLQNFNAEGMAVDPREKLSITWGYVKL